MLYCANKGSKSWFGCNKMTSMTNYRRNVRNRWVDCVAGDEQGICLCPCICLSISRSLVFECRIGRYDYCWVITNGVFHINTNLFKLNLLSVQGVGDADRLG